MYPLSCRNVVRPLVDLMALHLMLPLLLDLHVDLLLDLLLLLLQLTKVLRLLQVEHLNIS